MSKTTDNAVASPRGFDAFISYARTASTDAALALKNGLEQYNRPRLSARSTTVFRDDSSMSASASLMGTLNGALEQSRWMIVMLSPAAAKSTWVNREITWWLYNRSPETLLLVHNDGTIEWSGDDFTPESTAVPDALRGRLTDEPRWIDMTWFEGPESVRDPRFADTVLQLFCPIHGLDREDAVAQNSALVRRAKNLARGTITALSILLAAAIVASILAVQQRAEAVNQAAIATEQAHRAIAKQFASQSQQLLSTDIGTARLYAAQAWSMVDDSQTRSALLGSVLAAQETQAQVQLSGPVSELAVSQDGTVVYAGLSSGELVRWDVVAGDQTIIGNLGGQPEKLVTSRDGRVLAARTDPYAVGAGGSSTVGVWVDGAAVDLGIATARDITVSPSGKTILAGPFVTEGNYSQLQRVTLEGNVVTSGERTAPFDGGYGRLLGDNLSQIAMPDDDSVVVLSCAECGNPWTKRYELDGMKITGLITMKPGIRGFPSRLSADGTAALSDDTIYDTSVLSEAKDDFSGMAPQAEGRPTGATVGEYDDVMTLTPDGSRFVLSRDTELTVIEPGTAESAAKTVATLEGTQQIAALAMPNDELVVAADGSTLIVHELNPKMPLMQAIQLDISSGVTQANPMSDLSVSPDGELVAVGELPNGLHDPRLVVVSRDGQQLTQFVGRTFIAWQDATHFFVAGNDGIELYETGSETAVQAWSLPDWTPPDARSGVLGLHRAIGGHWYAATQVLSIFAGQKLYSLNTSTEEVDLATSEEVIVQIAGDGTQVLTIAGTPATDTETTARIYNQNMSELIWESQPTSGVYQYYLSGSHELVERASESDQLGETESGPALTYPHGQLPQGLVVSPAEEYVITSPQQGRLTVNSRTTGKPVGTFAFSASDGYRTRVAFAADGSTAVSLHGTGGGIESRVTFYEMRPQEWHDLACRLVGRPMAPDEWRSQVGSDPDVPLACS